MPYELHLPPLLRKRRWKVKIREKESREPPHVTILLGTKAWRIELRTAIFMDRIPDPKLVPEELLEFLFEPGNWQTLRTEWDRMYPRNPVQEQADNEA